jgi:hypothetical protein
MTHLLTTAAFIFLTAAGAPQERPASPPQDQQNQDQQDQPSDRAVNAAQPDFTIVGLPTTLRIPRFASSFRVTHRFNRPLGAGSFGDLAEDAFGFDAGGQIGLEYRFGIMAGTQLGLHRTSDRTIQFLGQRNLLVQGEGRPIGLDVIASIEGPENFSESDDFSPAIGAVISRTIGRVAAVYVHPIWINNTNPEPSELADDNSTTIIGIGGRVRIRPTVYLVAEAAPRVGFDPGGIHASFGIEKRQGGHSFQINFSKGLGTTLAQIARGGADDSDTWFIGFNISRKFF